MRKALLPGSFDPPTNGHLNIVLRSSNLFEELHVVIADNPGKEYVFTAQERYEMLTELLAPHQNVFVHIWDKLVVDFAEKIGARILVRGVRAMADFTYEFELSVLNKGLNPRIETIFMPTDREFFVLRSSAIKELARLGGDISTMVPGLVARRLRARLRGS